MWVMVRFFLCVSLFFLPAVSIFVLFHRILYYFLGKIFSLEHKKLPGGVLENLAVIMFSKFPSYLYQGKRKMNLAFTREFFAFTNSGGALFLERSYFIVNHQCASCYS